MYLVVLGNAQFAEADIADGVDTHEHFTSRSQHINTLLLGAQVDVSFRVLLDFLRFQSLCARNPFGQLAVLFQSKEFEVFGANPDSSLFVLVSVCYVLVRLEHSAEADALLAVRKFHDAVAGGAYPGFSVFSDKDIVDIGLYLLAIRNHGYGCKAFAVVYDETAV